MTPARKRTEGPNFSGDSVRVHDGESIYNHGKAVRQWLTKLLPPFEELVLNPRNSEPGYNYIPSAHHLSWSATFARATFGATSFRTVRNNDDVRARKMSTKKTRRKTGCQHHSSTNGVHLQLAASLRLFEANCQYN